MSGKVLGVKWDISRDLFLFDVNNKVKYLCVTCEPRGVVAPPGCPLPASPWSPLLAPTGHLLLLPPVCPLLALLACLLLAPPSYPVRDSPWMTQGLPHRIAHCLPRLPARFPGHCLGNCCPPCGLNLPAACFKVGCVSWRCVSFIHRVILVTLNLRPKWPMTRK